MSVNHLFSNVEFNHEEWYRHKHGIKEQLPPELLLGFKTLNVKSVLEPGAGAAWMSDCLPEDIFYCGFDPGEKVSIAKITPYAVKLIEILKNSGQITDDVKVEKGDVYKCDPAETIKQFTSNRRRNTFFIQTDIHAVATSPSLIANACGRDKFDALFTKGVLQLTTNILEDWLTILETFNIQHYLLYETLSEAKRDWRPIFIEKGFELLFQNFRGPSLTQIWRIPR